MDEETYSFEAQPDTSDQSGLSIHAGFPNPSEDARALSLDFNQLLVQHPNSTFIFRIRGHDWRAFGIWDGDLAIVDRLLDPRSSDVIVWSEENTPGFGLSYSKSGPENASTWGVVTAIVHSFRKVSYD
jgi:hypothetical protein